MACTCVLCRQPLHLIKACNCDVCRGVIEALRDYAREHEREMPIHVWRALDLPVH